MEVRHSRSTLWWGRSFKNRTAQGDTQTMDVRHSRSTLWRGMSSIIEQLKVILKQWKWGIPGPPCGGKEFYNRTAQCDTQTMEVRYSRSTLWRGMGSIIEQLKVTLERCNVTTKMPPLSYLPLSNSPLHLFDSVRLKIIYVAWLCIKRNGSLSWFTVYLWTWN